MATFRSEGFVLGVRPHGERDRIVKIFFRKEGARSGLFLVKKNHSPGSLFPSNRVLAEHHSRLHEHLGRFGLLEEIDGIVGWVVATPERLMALRTAVMHLELGLPEAMPMPDLYASFEGFLQKLLAIDGQAPHGEVDATQVLVEFEREVLTALGYGLDLRCCALTGCAEGLCWVSPRTGRAVSAAGERYRDRLLPLPKFLVKSAGQSGQSEQSGEATKATTAEVAEGLRLTGWFLRRGIYESLGRGFPVEREWLEAGVSGAQGQARLLVGPHASN